jgi:alkaline phosphatase D
MKVLVLLLTLLVSLEVFAQKSLLQSGPMVGYSTMREVKLWVQTKQAANVWITYTDSAEAGIVFSTDTVLTNKNAGFATHLIATDLQPGRTYNYQLHINKKKPVSFEYPLQFETQELWQWRKDPPAFSFAAGSCLFVNEERYDRPGKGYGSNFEILEAIYQQKPNFMLWLGDNTYLREADWNSKTGIYHRYTHTRSYPLLQPLLANTHHYATWDDHDYGPNDSDGSFWNMEITEQAFKDFWANPNYNLTGEGGVTGTFSWADCQFFLLDNRWFRTANNNTTYGERDYFGSKQIEWLINSLSSSRAPFKFIVSGGQLLNSQSLYENYAVFEKERLRLLSAIRKAGIEGVVFLSGDIHHSEINKMQENKVVYPFYEITSSALTAGISKGNVGSLYLVEGSEIYENNFVMLRVSGPRAKRLLDIQFYNHKNQLLYTKQITAQELRYN